MTQSAAEVAERWEQVARDADESVAQALIHPAGTAGPEAYRESGLTQARDLTTLAIELGVLEEAPARCLDFGCGDGRVLAELDPDLWEAWGTDTSPAMRQRARVRCAHAKVVMDLTPHLDAPPVSFELVYCLAVLIHLGWNDGADLVKEMARHVAPGGLLVLDVPLSPSPEEGGTWISVTSWSPARLELLTDVIGFEVVDTDTVPWHVLRRPV